MSLPNEPAYVTYSRGGRQNRVDLGETRTVFGRGRDCHVVLPLKGVSRVHFEILRVESDWFVHDLESTNHTFVNKRQVSQVRLEDGDQLTLGPPGLVPVTLVFHAPSSRVEDPEDAEPVPEDFWDQSEPLMQVDKESPSANAPDEVEFKAEADPSSAPSVNAMINMADYEKRITPTNQDSPNLEAGKSSVLNALSTSSRDFKVPQSHSGLVDSAVIIGLFTRMGHALLKSETLDEMLDQVLRLGFEELPAERGSVWLVDTGEGTVSNRATFHKNPDRSERIVVSRTIVNKAVRAKQSLLVSNAVEEFAGVHSIDQANIRSAICAPLYLEGRVLGFIYVDSVSNWIAFSEQHLEILTALAIFAAVGVEKWQMQEKADEERRQRQEVRLRVEALLDVAATMSSHLDTRRLMATIMSRARELLGAERASVFLVDRGKNELYSTFIEGAEAEVRFPIGVGIAGHVASTGLPVNIPDAHADERFNPAVDRATGYRTRSVLCMPLVSKSGEVVGVTQLVNKSAGGFTDEDEELFRAFCGQAAIAMENAALFDEALEMRNYLEGIMQSISQIVLTLNEKGQLVSNNRPFERLLGGQLAEMQTKSFTEWWPGNRNADLVEHIQRVYDDPTPIYAADVDLNGSGHPVSFNYNIVPLRDPKGNHDGVVIVLEDITERKRAMTTLGRYMSPVLAQKVLDEGGDRLGGVRQDVTVLFSDIRGYTSLTESLDAGRIVEILNAYFSLMVDGVFAEGGVLDKYIGDALMAVFGVPFVRDDDAVRACRSALRMQRALKEFNQWLSKSELPPVGIGIGISTGTVITGNIGSERRLEYTCIGDSVNVASRLEGATKTYGTTIIISEFTRAEVADEFLIRELDLIRVVGKQQPLRIYELIGDLQHDIDPRILRAIPHYRSGLDAYRRGHWESAGRAFQSVLDLIDDPPSRLFQKRCRAMMENPVEDWDGVWDMTQK
ncbi:GAF domain-containing protein [Thalassoroseus pseudoceratinae]|uniref:GAF domain-containing protein n=1 Tax=Thalassoroseus pseudoceratinae TaxID=2713176 RepID=UPI00142326E1|nr:GAF domain-containing protein [Thalassoroseus pseudoceratinae]